MWYYRDMSYERPENPEPSEWSKPRDPEKIRYPENYMIAAQDKAHIKPELDRIFRAADYDSQRHFESCVKCQKAAKEMIDRDVKKFGKPQGPDTPAWMLKK